MAKGTVLPSAAVQTISVILVLSFLSLCRSARHHPDYRMARDHPDHRTARDHPLRLLFDFVSTIFGTDQYDLWYRSIRSWVRSWVRINTIFGTDQYDLSGGSIRSLVRLKTIFRTDRYGL
jgi:hypothetical protein